MRHCLAVLFWFLCYPAIAQNTHAPISFVGDLLKNNAPKQITAYAISEIFVSVTPLPGTSGTVTVEGVKLFFRDCLVDPSYPCISPGQSRHITIVKDTYSRLEFLAAVFEDGTTYGDAEGTRQILDRRSNALEAYRDMIGRLESDLTANKSSQQILEQFKQAREIVTRRMQTRDTQYIYDIYGLVVDAAATNLACSTILEDLRQRMKILLESKPNLK